MKGLVCAVGVGLIALGTGNVLKLMGAPNEVHGWLLIVFVGVGLITGILSSQRTDR